MIAVLSTQIMQESDSNMKAKKEAVLTLRLTPETKRLLSEAAQLRGLSLNSQATVYINDGLRRDKKAKP